MTNSPDSHDQWQLAKSLFQAAIDLPTEDRETFFKLNCPDLALREVVRRMVQSHVRFDEFLVSPIAKKPDSAAADGPVSDLRVGQWVDDFRIIERIGSGGMGTVYSAQQRNPDRLAAIKILHLPTVPSLAEPSRFKQESQALARLQHPGIAHIYATGLHDFGQGAVPWIAMELIDGKPLDQFAKIQKLSVEQSLQFLILVCDAVQHAHDRGVIHRDLKPANILVVGGVEPSRSASPKVVDFGVAKILDPDQQLTRQTVVGEVVGTLNYMSPEHVAGKPECIDERTDEYALAVIGFELLSGTLPYSRRTGSLVESVRAIESGEIIRLGTLEPGLRGDLEVIFAKAMECDRTQRYPSVRAFAEDLRRFLNREPIQARTPSTAYRMRKFVGRNRILVGGIAGTMVALTIGLVMFAIEARHARAAAARSQYEADKAGAVNAFITNDFMMKLLAAATAGPTESRPTNMELVDQAAANIGSMFGNRPVIEAAVRNEVGTIYYNLGAFKQASTQFQLALELWESGLDPDHPDTLKAVNNLGQCWVILKRFEDAETLYRRALVGRQRALGESDPSTLTSMNNLAQLLSVTGRIDEAEAMLRRALSLQQKVLGDSHKDSLITMANLGTLLIQRGNIAEAKSLHLKVWDATRQTLGEDHITTMHAGSRAAQTLYRADEYAQAIAILLPVLDRFERLRGNDHMETITTRRLLAKIYFGQQNPQSAKAQLSQALESALRQPVEMTGTIAKIRRDLLQNTQ